MTPPRPPSNQQVEPRPGPETRCLRPARGAAQSDALSEASRVPLSEAQSVPLSITQSVPLSVPLSMARRACR
jgi:hypothetical protein